MALRQRSIVALAFALCLLAQDAAAQQALDTSYRTTYYEQKLTQFRQLPDTKGEIVFLGNSITDIGEWAEIWQDLRVKNRGISSDNTFGVLARLDEVLSARPAKIFLLIGINDIARGTPDSVIIANYRKIVATVRRTSPGTQLYLQSILPTNNEFTQFARHQNKDGHIQTVNAAIKTVAAQSGATYVDLYTRFLSEPAKMDKRYTNDGLHLTGEGFMLWKRILVEKGYMAEGGVHMNGKQKRR